MNVIMFGFKREGLAFLDEVQARALQNVDVKAGDVLLNITGASIGRVTLAPPDFQGARVNQHVCIIRPTEALDARYLAAYLSSPDMQAEIGAEHYGMTRQALTKQQILDFELPIPPRIEQIRIADKIGSLITRTKQSRQRLNRVPQILRTFREAVLEAAMSGRLTEEWRRDRGRSRDAWMTLSVGDLVAKIEAGLNVQCDERPPHSGEKGLVKISAVTWGTFDENESKTLPKGHDVPAATRIRAGDFLISRANTLELVGACVIVEQIRRPLYLSDKVLRLVVNDQDKPWLLMALRSRSGRTQIETLATGNQLSMRNLSQANLRSVELPFPPEDERSEIGRRAAELFNLADDLQRHLDRASDRLDNLTPSVLGKAFRGELVPQVPSHERATTLFGK
jgi:type I restriction enzyme S subunit